MMMKKYLLLFAMMLSMAVNAFAEEPICEEIGGFQYKIWTDIREASVTGTNNTGDITIPNGVSYNGVFYEVTGIEEYAFFYRTDITSVVISNSVKSIGERAFDHCTGLTSLILSDNLTSIGNQAFWDCSGLTSITIPDKVTTIGYGAFMGCRGLNSFNIPNSVTSIGAEAFYDTGWFENNNYDICILDNWLILGWYPIPDGVKGIADRAFYESSITSIEIPNSVKYIGAKAFYLCENLTNVTIGSGVEHIGGEAFGSCYGLTSVNITDIAAWCNIKFDSNPLWYAHHLFLNGVEIKDLGIPGNTKSIPNYAFIGCSGLTSVTIPDGVTSIGDEAFYQCSGITSVMIGNGVKSIGEEAFRECSNLNTVTMGNGVKSIGVSAFKECSDLTSVTMGNGLLRIEDYAFNGCTSLLSVVIPNSVAWVGEEAFAGCSSLTTVTIGKNVENMGWYPFASCPNLTTIISLNSTPPAFEERYRNHTPFANHNFRITVLWVPKGSKAAYNSSYWDYYGDIRELHVGDLNLDNMVKEDDLKATVDYIMGKDPEGFYRSIADQNGDEEVNAADVVILINNLGSSGW